jgi:N-acetylglucosaminyldiphosphoundecaprenol N-acetyl-beta-D-mannosaminyltransferase
MSSRFCLLNVQVDAVTISEINHIIEQIVDSGRKEIIANHNLNSVYLCKKDVKLKAFWHASYLTHIDGMPLIWWGKLLGYPLERKHRITYLDWVEPLFETINKNKWRVYYLGGKPGVAERAASVLSKSYKSISFKTHSGYFDSDENKLIIDSINDFSPNILMVGMGMPRQEKWILDNYKKIDANVILNSGACFDYIAGVQKAPPRFLGKLGLEWFYRLVKDPKRLYRRYLVEPISLLPLLFKDIKERL